MPARDVHFNTNPRPLPTLPSLPSPLSFFPLAQDFQSLCPQNDPDLIALHWYGTSHLDFQNYVLDMYATFNKPIMVTEYACSGTPDCTWEYIEGDFFQGTTVWMIGRPEIYRFSEFGAIPNLPVRLSVFFLSEVGRKATFLTLRFRSLAPRTRLSPTR